MGFFKSDEGGLRNIPDFVYWNGLFVLWVAVHYSTKVQGSSLASIVEFFLYVWLASFAVLVALKVYAREGRRETLDFDENLKRWHFDYIIVGLFLVEIIALASSMIAVKVQDLPFMAMWVPTLGLSSLSFAYYDDVLLNVGLVATAEELSKVVAQRLLYMKISGSALGRQFSVLVPIIFWAMLHGYKSYAIYGEAAMWVLITGAFLSGIVMYWVWKQTGNILAAIWVHGAHNSIVILSPVLKGLLV